MNINMTALGQIVAITSLLLAISLAVMAKRRALNVSGWAVIGLIPWLNIVGFFVLLFIRERSQSEISPAIKPLFRFKP